MDIPTMLQIVAAVIVANAAFGACVFAMYFVWRLQTQKPEINLPLWVYPCLIAAPLIVAAGFYLSPVH